MYVEGQHADGDTVKRNIPVLVGGVDPNGAAQTLAVGTAGGFAVNGPDADGATVTGNPILIAGVDVNGAVQRMLVGTDGSLTVAGTSIKPSTATLTSVASSASSVTLMAANAARVRFALTNDSTANLYVKFGSTATTSSYTVLLGPNDYYEDPSPSYTGIVDGIWSAANGNARVTELT